jgi:hypothetical protein
MNSPIHPFRLSLDELSRRDYLSKLPSDGLKALRVSRVGTLRTTLFGQVLHATRRRVMRAAVFRDATPCGDPGQTTESNERVPWAPERRGAVGLGQGKGI